MLQVEATSKTFLIHPSNFLTFIVILFCMEVLSTIVCNTAFWLNFRAENLDTSCVKGGEYIMLHTVQNGTLACNLKRRSAAVVARRCRDRAAAAYDTEKARMVDCRTSRIWCCESKATLLHWSYNDRYFIF
jgi:hypothetical protein